MSDPILRPCWGGWAALQPINGEIVSMSWDACPSAAEYDRDRGTLTAMDALGKETARLETEFAEQEARAFARLVRRQGGPV